MRMRRSRQLASIPVLNVQAIPPELLGRKADAADMPYNLLDRVIVAAHEGDEKDDKRVQGKVKALRATIERRLEGLKRIER